MLGRYVNVLLFVPQVAFGMTLAPIPIEELFREADTVAIVQVKEGHMLGEGEKSCGARYKGHVKHLFKGKEGSYIDFGHFQGYQVGERYLLFLTKRKDEILEFFAGVSADSEVKAFVADYKGRCEPLLSANRVMHGGNGAMKVTWSSSLQYKDGALIATRFVPIPDSLKGVKAEARDAASYEQAVWVRDEDMVQFLKGLK